MDEVEPAWEWRDQSDGPRTLAPFVREDVL